MNHKGSPDTTGRRAAAARDTLPGQRDALEPGTLGGVPVDPQGDENRDPPSGAPTTPPGTKRGAPPGRGDVPHPPEAAAAGLGSLHEVRAVFSDAARMQAAIGRLEISGFNRADLSLPEVDPPPERRTPESGAKAADTEDDARQARTLHTSTAASAAAMAAAGVTVATGGAMLPVVAAAVAAGAVIGGATYSISKVVSSGEQRDRDAKAASGTLVLSVRAPTNDMRTRAESILRAAGGHDLQVS